MQTQAIIIIGYADRLSVWRGVFARANSILNAFYLYLLNKCRSQRFSKERYKLVFEFYWKTFFFNMLIKDDIPLSLKYYVYLSLKCINLFSIVMKHIWIVFFKIRINVK